MTKQVKTKEEIHELVIKQLRCNAEFDSITPFQPYIHEMDNEGCNWDIDKWSGNVEDVKSAKIYLQEFVTTLRNNFNVIEDR